MSVQRGKQFVDLNKRAKINQAVMRALVQLDTFQKIIEIARTLMSASFIRIVARVRQMLNASTVLALIVVTVRLDSKMKRTMIENAWTWMSAKNILACVSIAV